MKKKVLLMLMILLTLTMCRKQKLEEITIVNGQFNGHDYVDLGLPSGLLWATCNIGADSPYDYGNYYAWGETMTKSIYTEENSMTWGQSIGDISGNPQYDAARVNWGGTWRLPIRSEFDELINNCTWTWTIRNNNYGYIVTGPNGNSIFLPAAGYREGFSLDDAGSDGAYWSSTPKESFITYDAYFLDFDSRELSMDWDDRCEGLSIRPVSD